jgi:hypothetical protein
MIYDLQYRLSKFPLGSINTPRRIKRSGRIKRGNDINFGNFVFFGSSA